jgi:hypothetical protein
LEASFAKNFRHTLVNEKGLTLLAFSGEGFLGTKVIKEPLMF